MRHPDMRVAMLTLGLAACQATPGEQGAQGVRHAGNATDGRELAYAVMHDVERRPVGRVRFIEDGAGLRIEASFSELQLEPGYHGFHIHQVGVCEPGAEAGPFMTAGGHYNPDDVDHGKHAGDYPALLVTERGTGSLTFVTDRLNLEQLLADDGTALILHVNADNFAHIPERYRAEDQAEPGPDAATRATGDAGDRYACGVITRHDE